MLVGHSYGGIIVTGVADQMPDAIGSIVFLDAFVPENGDTLAEMASSGGARCHGGRSIAEGRAVGMKPRRPRSSG